MQGTQERAETGGQHNGSRSPAGDEGAAPGCRSGCVLPLALLWGLKEHLVFVAGTAIVWWWFGPGGAMAALLFGVVGYVLGYYQLLRFLHQRGVSIGLERGPDGRSRVVVDRVGAEVDARVPRPPVETRLVGTDFERMRDMLESAFEDDAQDVSGTMVPFVLRYPDIGAVETRVATVGEGHPILPAGRYAFAESYCVDPECDCRRVRLSVLAQPEPGAILATIHYGWASKAYYEEWMGGMTPIPMHGVQLEPMAPQTRWARPLAQVFESLLQDESYAARIERHYRMMKQPAQRH